ncbi:hypothetical protein [uncultured Bacteroides sp.]|uniref:hypothetical protein n=1 Tax=uncultured Bacteroides sp. TaxID=162156 RepID=UPI002AAAD1A6|nr:hypothetical protein [uncultured Bacteroides sp.]
MKQKLLNISRILLVVLFISYYGGSTFFLHTHETPNGLITHSHPFKTGHTHSQAGFETIHLLSTILFIVYSIFSFKYTKVLYRILHSAKNLLYIHLDLTSNPLRAPPFTA